MLVIRLNLLTQTRDVYVNGAVRHLAVTVPYCLYKLLTSEYGVLLSKE